MISSRINQEHASQAVMTWKEHGQEASREKIRQCWEEAEAYNDSLQQDPFPFEPEPAMHEQYLKTLLLDDSQMIGALSIDSIGLMLPVYHTTEEDVLHKGAGHLEGSDLPTGRKGEHTLISGHSGLAGKEVFDHLDRLKIGDLFELSVLDRTFTYEVCEIETVLPSQYRSVAKDPELNLVTLVTCTPYGVNTHRLLVTGKRIDPKIEPAPVIDSEKNPSSKLTGLVPAAILSAVLLVFGLLIYFRKRSKKAE